MLSDWARVVGLACAVAAGCSADDGVEVEVGVGDITCQGDGDPIELSAPSRVRSGEFFRVEITTYGSPDCSEPSHVQVEPLANRTLLIPFDRYLSYQDPTAFCTWGRERNLHATDLAIDLPFFDGPTATHVLVLAGRACRPDEPEGLVQFEHTLTVEE